MFTGPRGLLLSFLGAGAVMIAAFSFGFQGSKDDADTARLFMTLAAAGEVADAHTLLHTSATGALTADQLAQMMAGMDAYSQITFPTFTLSIADGTQTATLEGTATTDSGCESAVAFTLVDGLITAFDITPLCRDGASDA